MTRDLASSDKKVNPAPSQFRRLSVTERYTDLDLSGTELNLRV